MAAISTGVYFLEHRHPFTVLMQHVGGSPIQATTAFDVV